MLTLCKEWSLFPGCFLIRGLVKTRSCYSWLSVLAPADIVGYRSSIKDLVCVLVAQSCPTLCDPMDCPWNSPAIILEWVAIPGDLPNPGTESRSPALQANSLPSALPRIKDLSLWELRKWKLSYATDVRLDLPPSLHTHTLESSLILTPSALNFAKRRLAERIFFPSWRDGDDGNVTAKYLCSQQTWI